MILSITVSVLPILNRLGVVKSVDVGSLVKSPGFFLSIAPKAKITVSDSEKSFVSSGVPATKFFCSESHKISLNFRRG